MKNLLISFVVVVATGFVLVAGYRVQGENNALRFSASCYEGENRLLKDQIHELEYKERSARTYAEGLTDGLMRSRNVGYTDGYHAAMNQVSEQEAAAKKSADRVLEKKEIAKPGI